MNAIMDLTARATSFITAIQTTLLRGAIALEKAKENFSVLSIEPNKFHDALWESINAEAGISEEKHQPPKDDSFFVKAIELFWVNGRDADDGTTKEICLSYAVSLSVNMAYWINRNLDKGLAELHEKNGDYPTPFKWRQFICAILYEYPDERVELATAMEYLPIQIVLALGAGNLSAYQQRILQVWKMKQAKPANFFDNKTVKWLHTYKEKNNFNEAAKDLLVSDKRLLDELVKNKVPLSFEQIFTAELNEIFANRKQRGKEEQVALPQKPDQPGDRNPPNACDPFEKARRMGGVTALAFSGGGIRSATFNLGILQGLAKNNLLKKFDYLSTVSGGGYIGSWLAAWIKRDGSAVKVTNRLCPDKSPEPAGEELRPIKWLRMFSNYFAPNASLMSADAWTVGVTWLRNTLLNQAIILLTLLSLLFFGNLVFIAWCHLAGLTMNYTLIHVIIWSMVALIPVSFVAGFGMHAYHSPQIRILKIGKEQTNWFSRIILAVAFLGAYCISIWLCSKWYYNGKQNLSFDQKVFALMPAAIVNAAALMIVALLGKYADCIRDLLRTKNKLWRETQTWSLLIGTALATAFVSLLSLAAVWSLLQHLHFKPHFLMDHINEIKFILGFPLVLEVFSVTLVVRMAFLGRYFPDERREWWGRMGAYIHRTSFLWILVTVSALLGKDFIFSLFHSAPVASTVTTGGWLAMILAAVKAAFSNLSSGKKDSNQTFSVVANVLALLGPYLFALGLLIFLPGLIRPIYDFVYFKIFDHPGPFKDFDEFYILVITLVCITIASALSWQVGVNEFSMHHFYRNRLVRAYLGATRRSTDRQKSSNPFTGFDMRDDEKLSKMTHANGYYGPFPILNAALNASEVTDLDRQDRKAESFVFTPLYCGFDFSMLKPSADTKTKSYDYAYRQTKDYAFKDDGPGIGTAMAISGAAVNPNQGYHSSAATAFLLTVFNVQMGWWMGNPRKSTWQSAEPRFGLAYIFNNLVGKTNTKSDYVALSDGGHFDNMGLYELIRRKCSTIVLCDAEQDEEFTCEGFANAVRRCRIDFGVDIIIDISQIVDRTDGFSACHFAIGEILYPGNPGEPGRLLYIKSSITKQCQPVDVYEYAKKHAAFPHQTTADQFFGEEQFESYRKLGLWIATQTFNQEVQEYMKLTGT